MSHQDATQIIRQSRGTHFDPDLVDVFFQVEEQVRRIRLELDEVGEPVTLGMLASLAGAATPVHVEKA
jgi:HD-GYP domain-containing protein (c-di-GMP phosphodiesterase class II)